MLPPLTRHSLLPPNQRRREERTVSSALLTTTPRYGSISSYHVLFSELLLSVAGSSKKEEWVLSLSRCHHRTLGSADGRKGEEASSPHSPWLVAANTYPWTFWSPDPSPHMLTHTHTHTHVHGHTQTHTHTHAVHTHTCSHTRSWTHSGTHTHMLPHTQLSTHSMHTSTHSCPRPRACIERLSLLQNL